MWDFHLPCSKQVLAKIQDPSSYLSSMFPHIYCIYKRHNLLLPPLFCLLFQQLKKPILSLVLTLLWITFTKLSFRFKQSQIKGLLTKSVVTPICTGEKWGSNISQKTLVASCCVINVTDVAWDLVDTHFNFCNTHWDRERSTFTEEDSE